MKSVIVLGAGMIGVATALHLQRRGWSVALVDRKDPGQETSYGNTGVIQSEAVRPYAMPRDLASLARIAIGRSNDVHYRLRSLPGQLGPLARYWWHSSPARHDRISQAYAPIIAQAACEHDDLIRAAGADNLVQRQGYRVLHRDKAALDEMVAMAETVRATYGVRFRVLGADDLARAEPQLTHAGVGAVHWLDPWTVSDPGGLATAYARLFVRLGGTIRRGDAAALTARSVGWSVTAADGRLDAEAAVVALGPWSPDLLHRLGYRFPMVRKRGYHRHYAGGSVPQLTLVDEVFGYVLAPMAQGLRITTAAELSGPDAPATPVQLARAEAAARQLLDLGKPVEAQPWLGTRPCMPDMLPVVGPAGRHPGLWLHFGHGHQGLTLGPVTGRLLAEMMSGEPPIVDPHPYRPDRF
jgi:D-amino-acid dehydrogenase